MNKEILYIVMPAYNEEANIQKVVSDWYVLLDGKHDLSRLVVADSGSTDQTHDILCAMQKEYPQLIVLEDTLKQHGPKVTALYHYAINQGADYVFQTDSDGQTSPKEFPFFWDNRKTFDAILGNRTVREDGKDRAFVERVVCFLLKLYFGVTVPDANAPFRLFNTTILKEYIDKIPAGYSLPNIILTAYFAYDNRKILFKEISFKNRQAGKNSINLLKLFNSGIASLIDFYKFRKKMG